MNDFDSIIKRMTVTHVGPEDYTGEDGLLYCGKCRTPKQFRMDASPLEGRLAPQQITDVLRQHGVPMLDIEMGVFHLRAFTVVVGKCPTAHSGVSESPALQIGHGLKVTAGLLLRCLLVKPRLFTLAGAGK